MERLRSKKKEIDYDVIQKILSEICGPGYDVEFRREIMIVRPREVEPPEPEDVKKCKSIGDYFFESAGGRPRTETGLMKNNKRTESPGSNSSDRVQATNAVAGSGTDMKLQSGAKSAGQDTTDILAVEAEPVEPQKVDDDPDDEEDPPAEDYSAPLRLEVGLDKNGDWVSIPEPGCYQGFCTIGSPGTGKTAGVMFPLMHQLIGHPSRPGGLILEVKGNFIKQVQIYCKRYGRENDLVILRPGGQYTYNPLYENGKADFIASRITEATVSLSGGMDPRDAFWIKSAEDAVRGMVELCRLTRGYFTMVDIFKFATDAEALAAEMTDLDKKLEAGTVSDEDAEGVDLWYTQWVGMEQKMKGNIVGEMTQFANLFVSMKEFRKTFCPAQKDVSFAGFEDAINKGQIVYLMMPPSEFGNPSASVATLLKLAYFDTVLRRVSTENEGRILRLYQELTLAQTDTKNLEGQYRALNATRAGAPRLSQNEITEKMALIDNAMKIRKSFESQKSVRRKAVLEIIVNDAKLVVLERFTKLSEQDANGILSGAGYQERDECWNRIQATCEEWLKRQNACAGVQGVLNRRRPTFFVCDEYQSFVSGGGMGSMKSDNTFYDRARESKCINIVAFQDYTSLLQKLRPDVVFNILSCLQNKIWTRLECPYSAAEASRTCKLSEDSSFKPSDFMSLAAFSAICKGSDGSNVVGPLKMELVRHYEQDRLPGRVLC